MNKRLLAAAFAVALPSLAAAQEVTLPPIVITASRTAQTVDEALAAVTVITREDIERRQPQSVLEALRGTPSLSFTNSGGPGKLSSVFLRGTESDHTLVLVDGIKVGDPTSSIAWQDLPIDQIERIEIVRGPRSSLYGSEAIGGVIQIFTRKGGGKPRVYGSAGYGSDSTHKSLIGVAGGNKRSWFNLSASHLESSGFNACRDAAGCWTVEPDDDGYRNTSIQGRVGYRLSETGEVELNILRAEGHNEYDSPGANENDFVEQIVGARLSFSPLSNWRASFIAGNALSEREYFQNGNRHNGQDLETSRNTLSWQNDFTLGDDHLFTAGLDYQRDKVEGDESFTTNERDNKAGFVQYQGAFGSHKLQLAGRYDDNEQFGEHTTGNIAWGYDWNRNLGFFASYGTAFKAPNFQELHIPWGGNPDLRPEKSRSFEAGLRGRVNELHWSLNAFQTDVDGLITYLAGIANNIEEARIRGLEANLATRVLGWTANANVTFLDPEDRSSEYRGNQLVRRARHSARFDLDREIGQLKIGGSVFAEDRRYDDRPNTRELGGYAIIDLRASYAITKDWSVRGTIGNVFDKDYETASYYNQPGRTWFLSLHYAPSAN